MLLAARPVCLEKFIGIEEDGDRTVVDDLDRHVRLKDSGCDAYSERLQGADKFFVERSALLRRCGVNEAGPALAARVAVERELRNGEYCAAHLQQRAIHFALIIAENAQVHDFFGRGCGRSWRIVSSHGDEDCEARANFARDVAVH